MPHPKNRVKQTGDTHAPDVAYDWDYRDERSVRYNDGYEPPSAPGQDDGNLRMAGAEASAPDEAAPAAATVREKVGASPLKMIGIALAAGFVLSRLFR